MADLPGPGVALVTRVPLDDLRMSVGHRLRRDWTKQDCNEGRPLNFAVQTTAEDVATLLGELEALGWRVDRVGTHSAQVYPAPVEEPAEPDPAWGDDRGPWLQKEDDEGELRDLVCPRCDASIGPKPGRHCPRCAYVPGIGSDTPPIIKSRPKTTGLRVGDGPAQLPPSDLLTLD